MTMKQCPYYKKCKFKSVFQSAIDHHMKYTKLHATTTTTTTPVASGAPEKI